MSFGNVFGAYRFNELYRKNGFKYEFSLQLMYQFSKNYHTSFGAEKVQLISLGSIYDCYFLTWNKKFSFGVHVSEIDSDHKEWDTKIIKVASLHDLSEVLGSDHASWFIGPVVKYNLDNWYGWLSVGMSGGILLCDDGNDFEQISFYDKNNILTYAFWSVGGKKPGYFCSQFLELSWFAEWFPLGLFTFQINHTIYQQEVTYRFKSVNVYGQEETLNIPQHLALKNFSVAIGINFFCLGDLISNSRLKKPKY